MPNFEFTTMLCVFACAVVAHAITTASPATQTVDFGCVCWDSDCHNTKSDDHARIGSSNCVADIALIQNTVVGTTLQCAKGTNSSPYPNHDWLYDSVSCRTTVAALNNNIIGAEFFCGPQHIGLLNCVEVIQSVNNYFNGVTYSPTKAPTTSPTTSPPTVSPTRPPTTAPTLRPTMAPTKFNEFKCLCWHPDCQTTKRINHTRLGSSTCNEGTIAIQSKVKEASLQCWHAAQDLPYLIDSNRCQESVDALNKAIGGGIKLYCGGYGRDLGLDHCDDNIDRVNEYFKDTFARDYQNMISTTPTPVANDDSENVTSPTLFANVSSAAGTTTPSWNSAIFVSVVALFALQ